LWQAVIDAQRLSPRDVAGIALLGRPAESYGPEQDLRPDRWRR
jgi:hypothetical protein